MHHVDSVSDGGYMLMNVELTYMEATKALRFPDICLPFGEDKRCSVSSALCSSVSVLPYVNTRVGKCAFAYTRPTTWNQLPEGMCQLQTTSFKHKLKTFLFVQCYNSADWLFLLFTNFSFIDNVMHPCPWPHCNRCTINSMMMTMMMVMMIVS